MTTHPHDDPSPADDLSPTDDLPQPSGRLVSGTHGAHGAHGAHEAHDALQNVHDSSEPGAPSLWVMVRRHIVLIGACTGLAGITAAVVTSRITPIYEATASLRIGEKVSPLSALADLSPSATSALGTELEMLRSRQLAEEVAESVSFQIRVREPRAAERSEIFAHVAVARTATIGPQRLVRGTDGKFVLLGALKDSVARAIGPRERIVAGGLTFELAPTASRYPLVAFDVLPFEEAVDSLQNASLATRRSRDAAIVDVSVRDPDPELARNVANTLVRRFIGGRQGARQLEALGTATFLREQVSRVAEQLGDAARALGAFRQRERIVNLPAEASSGVSRRAELEGQRNTLDAERQALDHLFRAAEPNGTAAADPAAYRELLAFPTLLKSGIASDLVTALTTAEERRAELLSRRTEQDPEVALITTRISQLQRQMRSRVATYLRGLTDQVAAIDSILSRSDAQLQSIPNKELRMAALERSAKDNEAIYSMLQGRLKEAEIAAAADDQSVRLVDAAILPRKPVSPKPLLTVALAVAAGGMLGLAGAFLRQHADHSLHTRHELLAVTGVPVLGLVPRLFTGRRLRAALGRDSRGNVRQQRLADSYGSFVGTGSMASPPPPATPWPSRAGETSVRSAPTGKGGRSSINLFIFTEALARLATNVALLAPDQRPRVLMVTSSTPGDGKTTVSANLALALARAGQRVLLIDADLRGGRIAQLVAIRRRVGLAELLGGQAEVEQVVEQVGTWSNGGLFVIANGELTGAPAELLGSVYAQRLLDWARSAYDTVVVDTPPLTSVSDAAVLAPLVDGVVLVARAGVTAREALMFTVDQLRIVRAPMLGAVLNDVDLRRDASYDGAYAYYGRYGTAAV
jgi:capsular exopolysaccharide synthesis family protein